MAPQDGCGMTTVYHGTPMTPRVALLDVCKGRAMCVSFYRPDDVEAVEAISPAVMFRQWRVFVLETSATQWRGMGGRPGLGGLFRLAGEPVVSPRTLGGYPRYAGRAVTAQRCTVERMAVRAKRRAAVAHGRAYRTLAQTVRQTRPGLLGLDRAGQGDRLPRIPRADGRSGQGFRQPLAGSPYDARGGGGFRLSVRQRRQHFIGTKRVAL